MRSFALQRLCLRRQVRSLSTLPPLMTRPCGWKMLTTALCAALGRSSLSHPGLLVLRPASQDRVHPAPARKGSCSACATLLPHNRPRVRCNCRRCRWGRSSGRLWSGRGWLQHGLHIQVVSDPVPHGSCARRYQCGAGEVSLPRIFIVQ